jgi:hypothetical protein
VREYRGRKPFSQTIQLVPDVKKPARKPVFLRSNPSYWLAPDAGAAIIAPEAGAAIADDALASEAAGAGAGAGAAAAGAEVSLAAAGAAWSLLLLQAASAKAAIREATRRDFFMITSFFWLKVSNSE